MTRAMEDPDTLRRRCAALEAELAEARARPARSESPWLLDMGRPSDQQRTIQALEASELKYRSLFSESPYGVLVVDPEGLALREFNPAMHRMLGCDHESFGTKALPDIEGRYGGEEIHGRVRRLLETGPEEFETELVACDGRRLTALISTKAIVLEGRPFLFCIVRDITPPGNWSASSGSTSLLWTVPTRPCVHHRWCRSLSFRQLRRHPHAGLRPEGAYVHEGVRCGPLLFAGTL